MVNCQMRSCTIGVVLGLMTVIVILLGLILTQWLNNGDKQVITNTPVDIVIIALVSIAMSSMLIVYILCKCVFKAIFSCANIHSQSILSNEAWTIFRSRFNRMPEQGVSIGSIKSVFFRQFDVQVGNVRCHPICITFKNNCWIIFWVHSISLHHALMF